MGSFYPYRSGLHALDGHRRACVGFGGSSIAFFDGPSGSLASWTARSTIILAFGAFYVYCRGVGACWGQGLEEERQIGDFIEHAVAPRGCAVAHGVNEALGGRGT